VEALVVSALEGIRAIDVGAEFLLLTDDPAYDRRVLGSDGIQIVANSDGFFTPTRFGTRQWLRAHIGDRARKERAIQHAIRSADLVLVSGGDIFGSEYGLPGLRRQLAILDLALSFGKKVVFLGHSIGPFKTSEELEAWAAVAARASLITLRESLSYEYVRKHLGAASARVEHTADVAFMLKPAEDCQALIKSLGLPSGRPVVACSISAGIVNFVSGEAKAEQHLASWLTCIAHVVEKLGAAVLLVPHVQESWHDDRLIMTRILRGLPPAVAEFVRFAGGDLRAGEYKALIGRCDFVIAERMHAAIAGLSSGVPTVVVGYSVKGRGILRDVMGDDSATDELLLGVTEFCQPDRAVAHVNSGWEKRAATRTLLLAAQPRLAAAARKNFTMLLEAIR